jgi:hypothetical protein
MVRRFENEARITSRLQHPGIVPVHDLGESPDGRPCIMMKLVEGHALDKLLEQRAALSQDLPRFLSIFEQICQTLAYAHVQGVIHRDLKPHNIMVGAFGEVQLMDWGFAKELRQAQSNGSPPLSVAESTAVVRLVDTVAEGDGTEVGLPIGTLPYMPPEQARGDVKRMDQRSDVFGLGAILCEILSGERPFRGANREELWERAKSCDHAEALARLDGCGADAELVALAKACLAAEPDARPRDAGVVAQKVAAYLAGVQERLRAAEARWYPRIAKLMLLLAAAFFVGHLAAFGLVRAGGPEPLLWLAVFAPYALLFAAFRANRAASPAGRQPQRLLWSIWVGHLFASVAVFLGCRLTAGADYVHGFLLAYPSYAALIGLAFFVMGSTYWSREYAFGLAWIALAALMPLFPLYAPLAVAVLSAVCDALIGLHLRRLGAAESLRKDPA